MGRSDLKSCLRHQHIQKPRPRLRKNEFRARAGATIISTLSLPVNHTPHAHCIHDGSRWSKKVQPLMDVVP
jgi:hypothetical protein